MGFVIGGTGFEVALVVVVTIDAATVLDEAELTVFGVEGTVPDVLGSEGMWQQAEQGADGQEENGERFHF